jgi:hypothetical protein
MKRKTKGAGNPLFFSFPAQAQLGVGNVRLGGQGCGSQGLAVIYGGQAYWKLKGRLKNSQA